jgi:hypothetical protein
LREHHFLVKWYAITEIEGLLYDVETFLKSSPPRARAPKRRAPSRDRDSSSPLGHVQSSRAARRGSPDSTLPPSSPPPPFSDTDDNLGEFDDTDEVRDVDDEGEVEDEGEGEDLFDQENIQKYVPRCYIYAGFGSCG